LREKHLARVHRELHVENRTTAAAVLHALRRAVR
jgi:hypothetical protein